MHAEDAFMTNYYVIPIYCDDCEEEKVTRAYERDGWIWFCCERCFLRDVVE